MRIGIFTDSYLPTPTGVAVSVETFRQSLTKFGHEVFIFAPKFKDFRDTAKNIYRFPSFFTPVRKDAPVVYPILDAPYDKISKINLNIVHSMHFFTIGTLGLKVAKKYGLPLVHTYHTNYEDYVKSYAPFIARIAKSYLISRSRNYCNQCDLVISPSPSMARKIKSYGITSKITSLPTGINLSEYKNPYTQDEFRAKYKIRKSGKLLLFVGRLGEEKNIKLLIEAFAIISKNNDVNLVFVGSGPSIDEYKNIVKNKKLDERVFFLGFLDKREVNKIYGACDLFVFPSVTETQGLVVVEAMAGGLVPIAMGHLGPSDIITSGRDGVLCKNEVNDFASNVTKVLADNDLRKKLIRGALQTAKTYGQENITKKLIALYNTLGKDVLAKEAV